MSSKVRAAVSGVSFESFHKSSARLIRTAVFGLHDGTTKIKDEFFFSKKKII